MKTELKNLLIGAIVATIGVSLIIKKEKEKPKNRVEKEPDILPVLTESNNTEEFVEPFSMQIVSLSRRTALELPQKFRNFRS